MRVRMKRVHVSFTQQLRAANSRSSTLAWISSVLHAASRLVNVGLGPVVVWLADGLTSKAITELL